METQELFADLVEMFTVSSEKALEISVLSAKGISFAYGPLCP